MYDFFILVKIIRLKFDEISFYEFKMYWNVDEYLIQAFLL